MCCLSVVKDFGLLRQYNIQMINEDAAKAKQTGSPATTSPESRSLSDSKPVDETTHQPEEPVQPSSSPDARDCGRSPSVTHPRSRSHSPQSQPTPED